MKNPYLYTDMSLKHVFILSIMSLSALAAHAFTLNDTILFDDGSLYIGEIADSLFNGNGKIIYADNTIYKGEWKDGMFNGKGELHFPDGDFYTGEFCNNEFSGYGVYWYSNGARYEGHWENGRFNGNGKMTYADGSTYSGEWRDDKREGLGVLNDASDSTLYKGYFHNDTYLTSNYDIYYEVNRGYEYLLEKETKDESKMNMFSLGLTYGTNHFLSMHFSVGQRTGPFAGIGIGMSVIQHGAGKRAYEVTIYTEYDEEGSAMSYAEHEVLVGWDDYPDEIVKEITFPQEQLLFETGWRWRHITLGGSAGVIWNKTIRNCRGGKGSHYNEGEFYYREKMADYKFGYRAFGEVAFRNFFDPETTDITSITLRAGYGNADGLFIGLGLYF